MTILFTKEFGTVNGAALQAFAAMCAAGQSYFGEALVVSARKFAADRIIKPKQIAALALDAYKSGRAHHDGDGPTPVGFTLNQSGIRHGGGRTTVILLWDGLVALECDSDDVLSHAKSTWRDALGAPQDDWSCQGGNSASVDAATEMSGYMNWADFDRLDRDLVYEWQEWAKKDLGWRARRAGLLSDGDPVKPELPAEALAWAKSYAEHYRETNKQRIPSKRVVVRRTPSSACEQAGLAHPTSRPEDRP
jgi:hypothetical protein